MYYIDYLRVRHALKIYAIVLFACVAFIVVSLPFSFAGHGDVSIGLTGESFARHRFDGIALIHELGKNVSLPFGFFCCAAAFLTIFYMMGSATSLSRFNGNLHFTWTKPVTRERGTLSTIAIDVAGIAIAFAISLVALLVPVTVVGLLGNVTFAADVLWVIAAGLGVAIMWYAMVQAATVRMRGGAGIVLGLSWVAFTGLVALGGLTVRQIPAFFVWIIHALDTIDPARYFDLFTYKSVSGSHGHAAQAWAYAEASRIPGAAGQLAIVWLTAVVAVAIAVLVRKRMEV